MPRRDFSLSSSETQQIKLWKNFYWFYFMTERSNNFPGENCCSINSPLDFLLFYSRISRAQSSSSPEIEFHAKKHNSTFNANSFEWFSLSPGLSLPPRSSLWFTLERGESAQKKGKESRKGDVVRANEHSGSSRKKWERSVECWLQKSVVVTPARGKLSR